MRITAKNMGDLAWEKQAGLIPAVVQDAGSGRLLMQAYMDREALLRTLESGYVTFYSRSRQTLWQKGETSVNTLECVSVNGDCDGDALLVLAHPAGPVCHLGTPTCWDQAESPSMLFLSELESIIKERSQGTPDESYTARLMARGIKYIAQKVGEEGVETALAAVAGEKAEILNESADLIYHLLVLLEASELSLNDVTQVLHKRHHG